MSLGLCPRCGRTQGQKCLQPENCYADQVRREYLLASAYGRIRRKLKRARKWRKN